MKRYVEVSAPGSQPRRYALSGGTVTLGTGRQAGIRAEHARGLLGEHVELSPGPDGCQIRLCRGVDSVLVYDGRSGGEHLVPWGQDAFVDHVRLSMIETEPEKHAGLLLVLLVALGLPLALFALRGVGHAIESAEKAPTAPPLTAEPAVACSQIDPGMASHRAERAHLGALAKVARYPFEAADGVEALGLFAEARACYEQGGRPEDAERVRSELGRWRDRLEQEYQAHQLGLERALENGAQAQALAEIARLRALLAHAGLDPYVAWLSRAERRLKRRGAGSPR